ncbi:MAG: DUF1569 domain-containing protein [Bacteroidia bacterium]
MKNLFSKQDKEEILQRISRLSENTQPQWGKMSVGQMLKHCTLPLALAMTNPKPKRTLMGRVIGGMAKGPVIGPAPFKKNGFTPKEFKVETKEVFNEQKTKLVSMLEKFSPASVSDKVHPFFGPLTEAEWGEGQYKHLDHHLTQFGV